MYFINNRLATLKCIFSGFFIILMISSGCKKSDSDNTPVDPPDDFTIIPPETKVRTAISVYMPSINASQGDVHITHYWIFYDKDKGGFSQQGNFDKYNTSISGSYPIDNSGYNGIYGTRYVPVSDAIRNYVDVDGVRGTDFASTPTGNGSGYFLLSNGSKINYSNYAFGQSLGNNKAYLTIAMADPTSPRYSICNISQTVDFNEQRWYLRYYGGMQIKFNPEVQTGKQVDIEYPVPANLQVNAPDTLEAWHFELNKWIKRGAAKKTGNIYKYSLSSGGSWRFGVREKGIYKVFQVRTADGIPVINAIVSVKDDISEIGAARTDASGNAICFVPTNRKLTVTIPPSWENPTSPFPEVVAAGPFGSSQNTPFVINYPAATNRLRVVKGKVTKCDGAPVENGTITVIEPIYGKTYCHIPVVNGQYNGAIVGDIWNNTVYALKLQDNITGQVGIDTTIKWQAGDIKNIDLRLCKASTTALFMDYMEDGVSYPIKGDTLTFDAATLKITASQGKNNIEFNIPADRTWPGSNFITFTTLVLNRVNTQKKGIGTLTITRYDAAGGLVEGYFVFNYTDLGLTEHEVRGIFRLKRTT
jgi:hypothetical protein